MDAHESRAGFRDVFATQVTPPPDAEHGSIYAAGIVDVDRDTRKVEAGVCLAMREQNAKIWQVKLGFTTASITRDSSSTQVQQWPDDLAPYDMDTGSTSGRAKWGGENYRIWCSGIRLEVAKSAAFTDLKAVYTANSLNRPAGVIEAVDALRDPSWGRAVPAAAMKETITSKTSETFADAVFKVYKGLGK